MPIQGENLANEIALAINAKKTIVRVFNLGSYHFFL